MRARVPACRREAEEQCAVGKSGVRLGPGRWLIVTALTLMVGCRCSAQRGAPPTSATVHYDEAQHRRRSQGEPTAIATPEATPVPPTAPPAPTALVASASATPPSAGTLLVEFPLETTELTGGQVLRVSVSVTGPEDEPIEGAAVKAELWAPDGSRFGSLTCVDIGGGRYLADHMRLPIRGTSGTWWVVAQASWPGGGHAGVERAILVLPSLSERYQEQYGFWIEPPGIFGINMAMYNLHSAGLHFEDHPNADGSGRVVLDNYRYTPTGATFADMNVYWSEASFPNDEGEARAHVEGLGRLYRQAVDSTVTVLTAELAAFQGRPAWRLTGGWRTPDRPRPGAHYPVEWTVLRCPGSDWVWTLAIYADRQGYLDDLRAVQATFECP